MLNHFKFKADSSKHLTKSSLLAYQGGELPPSRVRGVKEHLEACWKCRSDLRALEDSIDALMEFQEMVQSSETLAPSGRFTSFQSKLNAEVRQNAVREGARGSSWVLLLKRFSRPATAVAALTLIALFALLFYRTAPTTISAAELLIRTETAQSTEIKKVSAPVIHQKLRVRRKQIATNRESTSEYELWSDRSQWRFHLVSSQPEFIDDLRQVYLANKFDWSMPLSAAAFQQWHNSLSKKTDEVKEESGILTLTTTASENASRLEVERAQLLVRAADWHPIEERLWTKDEEFGISELQFEVLPLTTVAASIFGEPATTASPVASTLVPKEVLVAPSLPSPEELAIAEVDALVALHQVGADLGEPVEVAQARSGRVQVSGLVNSEKRKIELVQSLQNIPNVAVSIQTVDEAIRKAGSEADVSAEAQSARGVPRKSPTTQKLLENETLDTAVLTTKLPIQSQLESYFSAQFRRKVTPEKGEAVDQSEIQKRIVELSTKAVDSSEGALSEAWALRRLAKRYGTEEALNLPAPTRQKLENLVRDHVRALREHLDNERLLLTPVLNAVVGSALEPLAAGLPERASLDVSSGRWPGFPWALFEEVNQMDRLTNGLFAVAGLPLESEAPSPDGGPVRMKSPEKCATELLAYLKQMEARLSQLEKSLAGQFLEN